MKEKIIQIVKENTIKGNYKKNTITHISSIIELNRNTTAEYLNQLVEENYLIKIVEKPIYYIDKNVIESFYKTSIHGQMFNSFDILLQQIKKNDKHDFEKLIGANGSLKELINKCKAAISYPPNGLPILLHGPTGSGKSFIISLLFEYAKNNGILQPNAKYIHINCSEYANNPELLTANLFGYKKGAFTGAVEDNIGLIKAAENGILFLDEVHCLKNECQEKLFLFMDSGKYRMLGNNIDVFSSKVYLAFATTECPEDVLLKTLFRRIPIQLNVPSLSERDLSEKEQIIINTFVNESHNMHKSIFISNYAYQLLLSTKFIGNVGELKNSVQTSCMNALFNTEKEDKNLKINTLDLPDSIIVNADVNYQSIKEDIHHYLSIEDLSKKKEGTDLEFYRSSETLYNRLKNNEITMDYLLDQWIHILQKQFNKNLLELHNTKSAKENYIQMTIQSIIEDVTNKCGVSLKDYDINIIIYIICNPVKFNLENSGHLADLALVIKKRYEKDYLLAQEICNTFYSIFNKQVNSFVISLITLVLARCSCIDDINIPIGIIIAHGFATASSIANAVNQLLGKYVFDAIDMPLDTSTATIIHKMNQYLESRRNYQDVILLVDMGSLEEIYKGISDNISANLAIVNNVNTKLALSIGQDMCNHQTLEEIFNNVEKNNNLTYQILRKDNKHKVILCSCATGIGTAEKLKSILLNSLPKKIPINILTYDYSMLLEKKSEAEYFKKYNIICIIGTLNPKIEQIPFISIDELILKDGANDLCEKLNDLMNKQELEEFKKNILKNFSLTNIIESLTLLNPNQLLEHIVNAIDELQASLHQAFTNNTCLGLYVHLCCLVERLVIKDTDTNYQKTIKDYDNNDQKKIHFFKKAFKDVESYYNIQIPFEEIENIYIYINHFE